MAERRRARSACIDVAAGAAAASAATSCLPPSSNPTCLHAVKLLPHHSTVSCDVDMMVGWQGQFSDSVKNDLDLLVFRVSAAIR